MSEKGRIARAAGIMSSGTLVSRILGLIRDMAMTNLFGASGLTDSFFVAQKIPNMLREVFAEGAMSSAVIPVLTGYEKDDPEAGRKLVRALLGFSLVFVGLLCALATVFAPEIVSLIGFGFMAPEKAFAFDTTVDLARIMMPYLLLVSLASILMAALNTRRIFFIPSLSTAMYNLAFIVIIFLLASRMGQPIYAAGIAMAAGGFVQLVFQAPKFMGQGLSLVPSFRFGHPGLRRILRLVLPVMLGTAVIQVNIVIGSMLATSLAFGSVTYLYYSMRLIQFPIGMFGVAMGMAVLPSLSSHAHAGDMKSLRDDFAFALRLVFYIGVPAMAGLVALRVPIISTLFQHGDWGAVATLGTAKALLFYSFGLWATMGLKVLNSTFYSLSDTRTPVKTAVAALIFNLAMSLTLMGPMGHAGLALAQALAAMLNFTLLFTFLRSKLGTVSGRKILSSFCRSAASATLMGVSVWAASRGMDWTAPGGTLNKALMLSALISGAVLAYSALTVLMRSEEAGFVLKLVKKKFGMEKV